MALKPEFSIMAGLAVMGVVYAMHTNATPPDADIRALPAGNKDIDASERTATAMSIGVVSGISLLAHDPTILMMGAVAVVGMAVWSRTSNYTDSPAGRYLDPGDAMAAGTEAAGPAPEDTEPYTMFASAGSEFDR
ncbi:hypothetical protein GA0115240_105813 [Streptomyces sp. DvalAA-14]|uniref:hypothetical protein n=1 Tax=unclassified Streptomyces TaxID=2593676 RepID=UPI00081BA952|nr:MULTISPECIES: hypothetical protein [unclassified Streptomyces]MYS19162.1 hypothetical protein [Streptomyces sp. SID4948]SCD38117.1 hypothetical protein GA0115240_105813 [Streptomyces sp. DvalAA-14]